MGADQVVLGARRAEPLVLVGGALMVREALSRR